MIYNFHIDPGHGWIEVPYDQLVDLGIQHTISGYSYRDGDMCFLEEDCDAGRWSDAYEKQWRCKPLTRYVKHDLVDSPECFVHSLPRYYSGGW